MLLLLFGCGAPDGTPPGSPPPRADDTAPPVDTAVDTGRTDDTGGDTGAPVVFDEQVDVLVVGGGPAGIAAAFAAREGGATVLLVDRDTEPGWGLRTAGQGLAVASRWQEAAGIVDSLAQAQADWAAITGTDPMSPGVVDFLGNSGETLEWLEGYGLTVGLVHGDVEAGTVDRIHEISWGEVGGPSGVYALLDGEVRAGVEVTAPVRVDGAVAGVRWTDATTGETGTIGAGAVVLATGGFARDRAAVERSRPELSGRRLLFEANYQSDGGGLPFLDAAGAGVAVSGQMGVYLHSVQDPAFPEGESLLAIGAERGILVDARGERFMDEGLLRTFDAVDALPDGEVYAVLGGDMVTALLFSRPAYNWADPTEVELVSADDVAAAAEDAFFGGSLEEVAAAAGVELAGLSATVDAWNATVRGAGVDPFGRDLAEARPIGGTEFAILRLSPGVAKNFGGAATDAEGRVLDPSGVPIPGLYAAGEVAGMVLGGGGGEGFSGSVTACYWGGRVAGRAAAAFAGAAAPALPAAPPPM